MIQLLYYLQTAICFALIYWVVASRISLHSERQESATAMEHLRQEFQKPLRESKKQIKNLQEKNADMNKILNETTKENQELRLQTDAQTSAIEFQKIQFKDLTEAKDNAMAEQRRYIEELEETALTRLAQINQLEADLETSHQLSRNHLEEWDRDKEYLERTQQRLKETQQRLKFLTGKADQSSHIINSLKQSNDSAISQIMAYKEKIEKLERQLQDVKDETKELEGRHKRIWDYTLQHMREMNLPEVRINHFIQGAESAVHEITLDSFFAPPVTLASEAVNKAASPIFN